MIATSELQNDGVIGLEALEARLQTDLALLNLPPAAWLPPTTHAEGTVLDVAIIGAGMGGLVVAGALRLLGLQATLFDKAPRDLEGPWATTARMETLRSPKQVSGPALDLPALTFHAWYEAQFGRAAWEALDKIPRLQWAAYLSWYRRVLALDVRNKHAVKAVRPGPDRVVEITIEHADEQHTVLARRVVLALGLEAFGGSHIPQFVKGVPRERWSHSNDPLDYSRLAGRRVGVVGGSAAAMDSAATALEAGAARVDLLVRRRDFPRINYGKGAGNPGFLYGYPFLPDEWKWQFAQFTSSVGFPPPRASVLRVARHANAHFNFGCTIGRVEAGADNLHVFTSQGKFDLDHLILATGFDLDWQHHQEFSSFAGAVKTWNDVFTPPPGAELRAFGILPYLNRNFQFEPRIPGLLPGLEQIYCFCYPSAFSNGQVVGLIPGVSVGAKHLAQGIAASLYVEDKEILYQRILDFDDPELLGDEWVPETNGATPD